MAGSPPSEAETLRTVERLANDALPPGWSFNSRRETVGRRRQFNAEWTICSPDGNAATFAVEVKRSVIGRQLDDVLARLAEPEGRPLVAAPYLGGTLRASLADRGVSFADTTGNLRLVSDRPGLLVERQGGTKNPWPSDESLKSLRGRAAGRAYYLEPRGLSAIASKLGEAKWIYAATGAFAAQRFAPVAPARQLTIYVEDAALAAESLKLRLAETGANVALAEPFDQVVFDRTVVRRATMTDAHNGYGTEFKDYAGIGAGNSPGSGVIDGTGDGSGAIPDIRAVAPSQLAVDLLTGPGREPSDGDELLSWMRSNQVAWRV